MQISIESKEQTEKRLMKVISKSDFKVYNGSYFFDEFPLNKFKEKANFNALCFVRDNEVWSQLIESNDTEKELFGIFSFHFDDCEDNSGFVGWLANHLKDKFGTGVFVTCGQNSSRNGIFDYWGCPINLKEQIIQEIKKLIETGRNL